MVRDNRSQITFGERVKAALPSIQGSGCVAGLLERPSVDIGADVTLVCTLPINKSNEPNATGSHMSLAHLHSRAATLERAAECARLM